MSSRPTPNSDILHLAFTRRIQRTPRRSDATVTVDGIRYELPARFAHLHIGDPAHGQLGQKPHDSGRSQYRRTPGTFAAPGQNKKRLGQAPGYQHGNTGYPCLELKQRSPAGPFAQMARRLCRHRTAAGLPSQGGNQP